MNVAKAQELSGGLIWMPRDVYEIQHGTFGEFPFRDEMHADVASAMEDLAILQARMQRELMIDSSSVGVQTLDAQIQDTKNLIHQLFIPDFDLEHDKRIQLTPFESYDITGAFDIASLESRFRTQDEYYFALAMKKLASFSSEREQYLIRNDATLEEGERLAGIRSTQEILQTTRKQLAYFCVRDEFQELFESQS